MPECQGEPRSAPDCSQSRFKRIRRIHRRIHPPPSVRLASVRLGCPEEPRSAPDCSQSHFEKIRRIHFTPLCFRLVPSVTFWSARDGFIHPPPLFPGEPRSAPDCSQSHFGRIRRIRLPRSTQPRDSKQGLSECLAFPTYSKNYFELDCVFSSHP